MIKLTRHISELLIWTSANFYGCLLFLQEVFMGVMLEKVCLLLHLTMTLMSRKTSDFICFPSELCFLTLGVAEEIWGHFPPLSNLLWCLRNPFFFLPLKLINTNRICLSVGYFISIFLAQECLCDLYMQFFLCFYKTHFIISLNKISLPFWRFLTEKTLIISVLCYLCVLHNILSFF